jgi:hypothetical protein
MNKAMILTIVAAAALVSWAAAAADPPATIGYQGRLQDKTSGQPVNAVVTMTFSIYGVASGGTVLWTETQSGVTVDQGIFNVRLGKVVPIASSLFTGPDRWLGVKVGADAEMSPRVRLASVGFAMNAARVGGKRIQIGSATLTVSPAAASGTAAIVYPQPFLQNPTVTVSALDSQLGSVSFVATEVTNQSVSGCTVTFRSFTGASASGTAAFTWIAVGP